MQPYVYSPVYPLSDARSEPLPSTPPKQCPPVPQRATPTLSYIDIDHPDVHRFFAHLAFVSSAGSHHYIPPPSPAVFTLAALDVIRCGPTHPAHPFFWSPTQRAATAASVQRVIGACPTRPSLPLPPLTCPYSRFRHTAHHPVPLDKPRRSPRHARRTRGRARCSLFEAQGRTRVRG